MIINNAMCQALEKCPRAQLMLARVLFKNKYAVPVCGMFFIGFILPYNFDKPLSYRCFKGTN